MKSIIGRKIGMTSVFDKTGLMIPVSVVEVLPNVVLLKRTKERDGYEALQIGYEDKKPQRATKSELGIAEKAHTVPHYVYRELKGEEIYGHEVGDSIDCSIFKAGELVDVTGVSKGRGFVTTPRSVLRDTDLATTDKSVPWPPTDVATTVFIRDVLCLDTWDMSLQLY